MSWHRFQYIFTPAVENAMRYSIEEAIRKCAQRAGGGNSREMADEAVLSFIRKMEKHTRQTLALEQNVSNGETK